jgi:SAM-dependent methyltransferase
MAPLPLPHPHRSMLSDGRVLEVPLAKVSCLECGLVSHANPPSRQEVRQTYDQDYTLGVVESASDVARARNYAAAIASLGLAAREGRILEAGCGAGLVLRELAAMWPNAEFIGLEAAPRLARGQDTARLSIRQGFLEDLADGPGFDLVFSINVVEHAADPRRFLQAMTGQLSPHGMGIVICPDAVQPNVELLFADHLHSFTAQALKNFTSDGAWGESPSPFDGFRIYICRPTTGIARLPTASVDPMALHQRRTDYLSRWSRLDTLLLDRSKNADRLSCFGAGEAAALLRAYTPGAWNKVDVLAVDQPAVSTLFGKPVVDIATLRPAPGHAILLATHPNSQSRIGDRLSAMGFDVVRWDDEIAR